MITDIEKLRVDIAEIAMDLHAIEILSDDSDSEFLIDFLELHDDDYLHKRFRFGKESIRVTCYYSSEKNRRKIVTF